MLLMQLQDSHENLCTLGSVSKTEVMSSLKSECVWLGGRKRDCLWILAVEKQQNNQNL